MKYLMCLYFFTCYVSSQCQIQYHKLDSLLTTKHAENDFSGVVIVSKGDKIQYANALGYADYEKRIPLRLETSFDLSSGGKLFTAAAIGLLVDEGKVNFNDPVSMYFPQIPEAEKMTVAHLMTHNSGLTDFYRSEKFDDYDGIYSCKDLIPIIEKEDLKFQPGDSVFYSTSGMILLGAIVEKVSGLSFPAFVNERIIRALDLKNTYFGSYFQVQDYPDRDAKYARGYIRNESGIILEKDPYESINTLRVLSAGGIYSSALDMIKLMRAKVRNTDFISHETFDQMTTKHSKTNWTQSFYGYGYIINVVNEGLDKEAWGHAGNSTGHHSITFYYPNHDTYLVILLNYGFVNPFDLVHNEIEKILFE